MPRDLVNFESESRLLRRLSGNAKGRAPYWFLRQAGRYLPEYRKVRQSAGSFLDLCYNPELACEVTLQPIERFDCDAAIIFADILLIAQALGMKLRFEEGVGPILETDSIPDLLRAYPRTNINDVVGPVYETVQRTRTALSEDKAVIGFAGAPWTVALYMLAGGSTKNPADFRRIMYQDPEFLRELIDVLVDATGKYLIEQIRSGADVVQIFDSWAGDLPLPVLEEVSIRPLTKIIDIVREECPKTPIILFPKGAGLHLHKYACETRCDAISIDFATPLYGAAGRLSSLCSLQGGVDPLIFACANEGQVERVTRETLQMMKGVPYIFNVGHGLTPQTQIANIERCVQTIRQS